MIVPLSDVSEAFLLTIVESVDIASDEMKRITKNVVKNSLLIFYAFPYLISDLANLKHYCISKIMLRTQN